jgi:hypothetical protein
MSMQELTKSSQAVLVGKCADMQSFWNEKHDKIFTRITIQADQYLKGDLGAETVVTMPGGRVGDIIYEVSDMPVLKPGEEMVVFLWRHPSGITMINGGINGKRLIRVDKKTGKKMVDKVVQKHVADDVKKSREVFLDEFIEEVSKYTKE